MHTPITTAHARLTRCATALIVATVIAGVLGAGSPMVMGQSPGVAPLRGGTLRVARPQAPLPPFSDPAMLDPLGFVTTVDTLHRCCLSRTLLAHQGKSIEEGGADIHPDAAASLPTISPDGLEWIFRLKPGLRFGPPFEDVPITAGDYIRGFHRALSPAFDASLGTTIQFGAIEGAATYAAGQAATISGLEAPDDRTLIIRLTEPSGALEARLALPLIVPIPANPCDVDAPLGIAQGHDAGMGPFYVSSGPYMLEGSEQLDFCRPVEEQQPVGSLAAGDAVVLVRNPAWDGATDSLRPAYADRIEISMAGSVDERLTEVLEDRADLFWNPFSLLQTVPSERLADFGPERTFVDDWDIVIGNVMNVAVSPFDDIHVRRAVNHAIDRARVADALGGPYTAVPAGHIAPDGLLDGLLRDWDPYGTTDGRADLDAARAEMARSSYDRDGDGRCDADACRQVRAVTRDLSAVPEGKALWRAVTDSMRDDLASIGIDLHVEALPTDTFIPTAFDPRERVPLTLGVAWVGGEMNGSTHFVDAFHRSAITDVLGNGSLVGATPDQLAAWGYETTEVPDVDARIEACLPLTGSAQFECWAGLDQYLMTEVVPWTPLTTRRHVAVGGPRIVEYSWSAAAGTPAFDRIAVAP